MRTSPCIVVAVTIGYFGFQAGASAQTPTIRLCDVVSQGSERARWVDVPENDAVELMLLGAYSEGEGQCPPARTSAIASKPGAAQVCADRSTICHVPDGNPAGASRVTAAMPELEVHLKHPDDVLIGCGLQPAEIDVIDCAALVLGQKNDSGDKRDATVGIESNSKTKAKANVRGKPVDASVAKASIGGMEPSRGVVSFTICDQRVGETGRIVDVNAIGRIDSAPHGCD